MALEDFTTYTEVDPNNSFTVTSNLVDISGLNGDDDQRVYKDHGVNHFSEDFTHQFECDFWNTSNQERIIYYQLCNDLDDFLDIDTANGDALAFVHIGSPHLQFIMVDGAALEFDTFSSAQINTRYFITLIRDDDGGTSNAGLYTAYIRTGSHEGTLVDTLVFESANQYDWRYVFSPAGYGTGAGPVDGSIRDLNLNESADAFVKIITVAYATVEKINTVSKSTIAKIFNVST